MIHSYFDFMAFFFIMTLIQIFNNVKMSTSEIQDIVFKAGVFVFEGGNKNEGMIVPHYNIQSAKIEYFFIPSSRINDYMQAREKQHQEAYRYYGNLVEEGAIKQALHY